MLSKWLKISSFSRVIPKIEISDDRQKEGRKKVKLQKSIFPSTQLKVESIGNFSLQLNKEEITLKLRNVVGEDESRSTVGVNIQINDDENLYNRLYIELYIDAIGFINFYFHFSIFYDNKILTHTESLAPNKWHKIFICYDETVKNISNIHIIPFLFGTPPEALPEFEVKIRKIAFQKVEFEEDYGFNLHEKIAYAHCGYFINYPKTAIVENSQAVEFYLINQQKEVVYQNQVKKITSLLGAFDILDFSDFMLPGTYYLRIGQKKSKSFKINQNPYELAMWKSLLFLKSLRCGENVDDVHSVCHLNCYGINSLGQTLPTFGGWHDAGDVSQFAICTAEITTSLCHLAMSYQDDKVLYTRLLEEIRVGSDWLLHTIFPNHERLLAVLYKRWYQNVKNDDRVIITSYAEKGPFENFLICISLLNTAKVFASKLPDYANYCQRVATMDFQTGIEAYENNIYTKRWGPSIDALVSGVGAKSAALLYELTKETYYLEKATFFGRILIECQEVEKLERYNNIRGFFYENYHHQHLVTFEHRGHEQVLIEGLITLLKVFPKHNDASKWHQAIILYKEYILKTIMYTSPYGVLPAQIYDLDKIKLQNFTYSHELNEDDVINDLQNQIKQGFKLSDKAYLRIFPISISRRGFHATLLSKTKAVSLIANYLKDQELMRIVVNQLEWIMGKNPFSTSTMYGEGYDNHPLYVAYSNQLIGSLPVGFKTKNDEDKPYWPKINNAVYKEVWGHTTSKFLEILADITKKKPK